MTDRCRSLPARAADHSLIHSNEKSERLSESPFVGADFPDDDYEQVVEILLSKRAFDLGSYKDRCIKRRIASRVRARGFRTSAPYVELLREDNDELDALLAVLTIHVSQFFRNPSTYQVLEEIILPDLVGRLRQQGRDRLNIWSVGCAGGEEPYSLALILNELPHDGLHVSILGTDVSPTIIRQAERAEFDAQRLAEVPDEVRNRYFNQLEGTRFRLVDDIRNMVEFRQHDVLNAEQFPEADLILCRNVMIYFSRMEQTAILNRFARSLRGEGFLVLGRAETLVGTARSMFGSEHPVERIYRCQQEPADEILC